MFRGTSVGPEGGALDLGIFDLSGRRIRQLHGASSPVRFEIAWDGKAEDGTRIPPGLYFARARQGAQEVKQVLIRVE